MSSPRTRRRWVVTMGLYLMGIFMGAIDTGIVTPARTVIQHDLRVDDTLGIWLITMYTLAYAASIPIMGKLADRMGRKPVYLAAIALFGVGSLLCGLAQDVGSFGMLIAARAVQAVGGGGILPIATAEVGTEVPEDRRGMALGLVGAVYGVANIFGASAGSLILDVAGATNWQWIFYVNVPIAALIVIAGALLLPNHREDDVPPLDALGTVLVVAMILALLYGLRNLDVFDLGGSLASPDVYPYLLAFLALLPVLVWAERRAADPILNLGYFTDRAIGLTLALSFLSGFILMGVVFVPQLAENSLRIPSGSGGYLVIVLGLASGIGAPLSGRLTDAFGPKAVLGTGGVISAAAAAAVIWWLVPAPSMVSVIVTLALLGLGLGFIVGSPLNFMMLRLTPPEQSNSALGTLSLVRSIATTLAPAIMVGFVAHAGLTLQDEITEQLPSSIQAPELPYAASLQRTFDELRDDERVADQLKGVELPDLASRTTIEIDSTGGQLPPDLVELLKTADVTTIAARTKTVASRMFAQQAPQAIADIEDGVSEGIRGVDSGAKKLGRTHATMGKKIASMDKGLTKMRRGLVKMDASLAGMRTGLARMGRGIDGMSRGIDGLTRAIPKLTRERARMSEAITGLGKGIAGTRRGIAGLSSATRGLSSAIRGIDAGLGEQRAALARLEASGDPQMAPQIERLKASIAALEGRRAPLAERRRTLTAKLNSLRAKHAELVTARARLVKGRTALTAQRDKMIAQRDQLTAQRAKLTAARAKLRTGYAKLSSARAELAASRAKLKRGRASLASARAEVADARDELRETARRLRVLKAAVPGAFDRALADYLAEIDRRAPAVERTFQVTLNRGFRDLYLLYGAACVLLVALLPLVPMPPRTRAGRPAEGEDEPA